MKKIGLLPALILFFLFLTIGSCSDSSVTDFKPTGVQSTTTTTPTGNAPAAITLSVTPSTGLSAAGTATVAATVRDSANAAVQDGTTVSFSVANTALGTITPTATTVSGIATATFTAANTAGTVTISSTSGTITTTANITILGANVGSIQFVSATPNVIGVKGSGQTENSVVTFSVKDINGQPASNGTTVTFTVNGPKGGETINPLTASTVDGAVSTTLQSGSVAGPVRVNAATIVATTPISTSSTGVSIGGGIPSYSHLSVAASRLNLAGLDYDNLQSTITTYLADRFGNFNVLQGTSVSFYAEAGAIDRNNTTNETGSTSVTFRTQAPMPSTSAVAYTGFFPAALTGNPNVGLASIIAVTRGEECFVDNNGNGVYDGSAIDSFPAGCDIGEPFIDADGDGNRGAGTEFYIDANQNGVYDGPNTVWDGNLMIWKEIEIAFSGSPVQITVTPVGGAASFTIADGTAQTFQLCVADANGNSMMGGSTIATASTTGTLTGGSATLGEIGAGPYCTNFVLADSKAGDTDPAEPYTLTVTVTSKVPNVADSTTIVAFSGSIN